MSETVKASTAKLAESAKTLEKSTARVEDSADRRTELAGDRTAFAAERTYGAWVRTGLFALASGVGAKAALHGVVPEWLILANGSALVLFSAFCFIVAVWPPLIPAQTLPWHVRRVPPLMLMTVNALLTLTALAALLGIWFGRTGGHPPGI